MLYSSSDVARETGMTQEGLRFYEKKGIIEVSKEENGYRVYPIMNVPFLRTVRLLNKYGLSLDHISDLFQEPQEEQLSRLLEALREQEKTTALELARRQKGLECLSRRNRILEDSLREPGRIWERKLGELCYLEYYDSLFLRKHKNLQGAVARWLEQIPIVQACPRLPLEEIGREGAYCPAGFILPVEDLDLTGLEENEWTRRIPAGNYLCAMSLQAEPGQICTGQIVPTLLQEAKRRGAVPAGDVLFTALAATRGDDGSNLLHYLVMMPLMQG